MPSPVPAPLKSFACRVAFGGSAAGATGEDPPALRVAVARLAGDDRETLLEAAGAATTRNDVWFFPGRELCGGFGLARPDLDLEAATTDLYQAAHAQAVRDYELNRLFNPEHYGIEADDYQI